LADRSADVESRIAAVIMAAGRGTRMKSALPKAAHLLCGKPITRHVIDACRQAGIEDIIVIVGHEAETVMAALGDDVTYAQQTEQLGTGHACMQAIPHLGAGVTDVLVLPGDTPLITPSALQELTGAHRQEGNAATLLTAVLDDPCHYGRVIRHCKGEVLRIVEAKDANEGILAVNEVNTSIYIFDKEPLAENLNDISSDNAQKEYYLTDVVELLNRAGLRVGAVTVENPDEVLGINNRAELAQAAAIMRDRILKELMLSGVTVVDPSTTYIECDVQIGPDSVIQPFTMIEHGTRIGTNCEVGPFARLRGVEIADGQRGVSANE
jgi:bifunctional UDP-N-acetylglucosamine pyrophosphorylase / glucosamine-1-phosphate N-acetyltransferase